MYKGFNLKTNGSNFDGCDVYIKDLYDDYKWEVENNLDLYVCKNGNLDGDKIINNWFPEINAHVFISHSHNDEILAKNFAGWLKDNFNIDSFIDSCVWGYLDDLQKKIDEKFSQSDYETGYYDYTKRNYSTSHVHIMLSTALMSMMDKCECVIFLNTDNSTVQSKGEYTTDDSKVSSPWIYDELIMTNYLREKIPQRILKENQPFLEHSKDIKDYQQLIIEYGDKAFDNLIPIDDDIIEDFYNSTLNDRLLSKLEIGYINPENMLDSLYSLTKHIKKGRKYE